jgi:hypothetical protein
MNTYTIYLHNNEIAQIWGTEYAYEVWFKVKELAQLLGHEACMVWDATGEEVCSVEAPESFECDYEPDVDECGFDPYMGCYTEDC